MKYVVVHKGLSTFVKKDVDILQAKAVHFRNKWYFVWHFFYFMFVKYDRYFVRFCDIHAFWPVFWAWVYGRRSYIIVGGFDAHCLPELNYGLFLRKGLKRIIPVMAYHLCDKILPVDKSLQKNIERWTGIKGKYQTIRNGYNDKIHIYLKMYDFITVANIDSHQTYLRKGIDVFESLAKQMKEYSFVVVGGSYNGQIGNVIYFSNQPHEEVIKLMAQSRVYCQFSKAEGLPNTLCEAMLQGCVPIGTPVNGIKSAIDGVGVITAKPTREKMLKAYSMSGVPATERIIKHYSLKRRADKLLSL
jgi:glycosyltransferase involved in cell wall biosynthesis